MSKTLILEVQTLWERITIPYLPGDLKALEADARNIESEGKFDGQVVLALVLTEGSAVLWKRNLPNPVGPATPSPPTTSVGVSSASPTFPMSFEEYAKWGRSRSPGAARSEWPSPKPSAPLGILDLNALFPDPVRKK